MIGAMSCMHERLKAIWHSIFGVGWRLGLVVYATGVAYAQHPTEIERLASKGEYFKALATYEKMPKRISTAGAAIAAGKSAWALSLPDRAIEEFERALKDELLDEISRARIYLSRGIVEHQEERFQVSILYAEKAITILREGGPLRSKAWMLWGENLSKLQSYGAAEDKYLKALEESSVEEKAGVLYALGLTQIKLGKNEEASKSFQQIPLKHESASLALRELAQIALYQNEPEQASFWLERGKSEYPEQFLDSWIDYVFVQAAILRNDAKSVTAIKEEANRKFAPSDEWLNLINAASEGFYWKNLGSKKDKPTVGE